jgi:hypothetical protein
VALGHRFARSIVPATDANVQVPRETAVGSRYRSERRLPGP